MLDRLHANLEGRPWAGVEVASQAQDQPLPWLIVKRGREISKMLEFTVGINVAGERRSVSVSAEDALIAALKVKHEKPDAIINYVRRSNRRGDRRHPHKSINEPK
jgi:hypothetical protein